MTQPTLTTLGTKLGHWPRLLLTFATVLSLNWVHRITVTSIFYFNNNGFNWHYQARDGLNPLTKFIEIYGQSLLLGLKTDILFAIPVTGILFLLGRVGLYLGLALLALLYAANAEHIRFNESNLDPSLISMALNPTFIAGQSTSTLFFTLIGFIGFIVMLLWFARRKSTLIGIGIAVVVGAAAVAIAPAATRYDQPIWMQTHPLMPMIGREDLPVDDKEFSTAIFDQIPEPFSPVPAKHNVLMVFLEGLSENSLAISDMSYVQSLAAQNLHFRQYIGHQLLTANGIYASHTANLPYFTNVPMRWYGLDASSPELENALPRILRENGYQTTFIQSAPLSFMEKDRVLPLLGYDDVIGAESILIPGLRNGWGVDDLSLMQATLDRIDQFDADRPWITTVLTTGTHSPYNVPSDFLPDGTTDRYRASRYADDAVNALINGLDDRGLLDNTVVIITSDESREFSPGTQLEVDVHRSWLPFIVLHPNGLQAKIDNPVAMVDARDLVLAATGDLNTETIDQITSQRDTFVMGNVRLKQLFYYTPKDEELYACITNHFVCHVYGNVTDLRDMKDVQPLQVAEFPGLERIFRRREGAEVECEDGLALCR